MSTQPSRQPRKLVMELFGLSLGLRLQIHHGDTEALSKPE